MRKLFLSSVVMASVVVLFGCPKKKGVGADGGDEAGTEEVADATVVDAAPAAAAPTAKNAADVARFPGETKIEDEATKTASVTVAHTAPRGGTSVATLKAGTDVTKIASFQDGFLVTFTDPKDATSTLMGWIGKEAFVSLAVVITDAGAKAADASVAKDAGPVVSVDAGKVALKCAGTQLAVVLSAGTVCRKRCSTDADCGGAKGSCSVAAAEKGGRAVHVCVNE
jgi:hypothetical protein